MGAADSSGTQAFTTKGLATRERILRAAAEVILSEGLTGFSNEKVRQAASVSGSQLSHYFDDRQSLIRAVLERQIEVVLDFHRQPALHGLDTFTDWEHWADLNMRYLRKIGYRSTPTYHTLAGQLAKSDDETRRTFANGYWRWVDLLTESFQRMKDRGVLVSAAEPRQLALVVVAGHQGAGTLAFAYRQSWPLADMTRFIVNYLRLFAVDPAERVPRPPRRRRGRPVDPAADTEPGDARYTSKGMATRARIVDGAAELILQRGVRGTSLIDVRRHVGVSGSQLSHYFTDKHDLTRQVIAARRRCVEEFHTQPELRRLDTLPALRRWAELCWQESGSCYLENGCVYGSLAGELLEADDLLLDDLAVGYDRWLQLFEDGLTAMRASGELCPDAHPRHLAVALVGAHQGGTMLTHMTKSADPFRAVVDAAVDYVASFQPVPRKRAVRKVSRSKAKR
ncbi:TetR/AcrR family transcriptional regulator [Mycolicibacterium holsaticum]|uniref:TetR family transcriptional regulator n=1 Tax=Mycolicibacterium holsaticum TaxID=152142 RepID=A0A1E3RVW1_9MYCO|nr:TetR/AcrR family transcriptional regulator [Mycolicibacterium holsaticum]ODQ93990.1 TetR family transcriptional regulator [Mycolicibacterium holsaticum]